MSTIHKSFFFRYKLHHLLFWALYSLMWYGFGQLFTPPEHRGLTRDTVLVNLVYLFTHSTASYISMYYLMPCYLFPKKHALFFTFLLLDILAFSALVALGFYLVFRNNPEALAGVFQWASIIPATLFSVAATVGMLSAAKLMQVKRRAERKTSLLEKEKLETELNYLKAQINPHFLFNAINNIYFLINKDKDLAGDMLLKFSELLRYQLYDCNAPSIPVQTEILYLQNFIDLEKIRKGEKVRVAFNNRLSNNFSIAPLLLIPFVENAFKYVSTTAVQDNFINITLDYLEPFFLFSIENGKLPDAEISGRRGGIGLENVQRRLSLIYGNRHTLHISQTPARFHVSLSIDVVHEDK